MKFSIITDIHYGEQRKSYTGEYRKLNKNADKMLSEYCDFVNKNSEIDFVMVLGDLVNEQSEEDDRKNMKKVIESLGPINYPIYYMPGNHDLHYLKEQEVKDFFKKESFYYSFDNKDYHFIILFTRDEKHKNAVISQEQINFLKKDLENTTKKTVVFTHYSLADQDLTGNHYFEGCPEYCLVDNREEVRKILEDSGKVIGVFNGHLHWNNKTIHNNIPYYTIQSLVENEDGKGIPANAYAVISLEEKNIKVEVKGNYEKTL